MVRWLLLTVGVAATACSGSAPAATAPPLTAPSTTPTTALPTTMTATTTDSSTATTLSRTEEIEAIFHDLEFRRLDALYRQDEAAFRVLFSNQAYLEASFPILGTLQFIAPPARDRFDVDIRQVLIDRPDCLAARVNEDATSSLGPGAISLNTIVITPIGMGWGLAYTGTGWQCDGPHPLES